MSDLLATATAIALFLLFTAVLGWQARQRGQTTADYVVEHNRAAFSRKGVWLWPIAVIAVIAALMLLVDGFSRRSFEAAGALLGTAIVGSILVTVVNRRTGN